MTDLSVLGSDFSYAFLSIIFEGVPFILLGTLVSGFIDVYLPSGTLERVLPKRPVLSVLAAGLLGLFLPVCECAIVPVIRRLVKKGLPFSTALTYMLAAPIVNPITAISTFSAFKGQDPGLFTASRLGLGYLLAVAVGLILLKFRPSKVLKASVIDQESAPSCCGHEHEHGHDHGPQPSRLVLAMRSALKDFVEVAVYFSIGVAAAAFFNVSSVFGAGEMSQLASGQLTGPISLMVMAFVISLCSSSDAFIAATLDRFSYAAKLAFMLFGPMMDVKLIFLYSTVLRKKFIAVLAVGLFLSVLILSVAWELVFGL